MMSYADLEKAYRVERSSPVLQKLPDGFWQDARALAASPQAGEYLTAIRECMEKLFAQRANKIIHYAGRDVMHVKPPENISPEELPLYNGIASAVAEHRTAVLDKSVEPVAEPKASKPTVRVRIKHAMPVIIGSDEKEYGPFKEDDVVELPDDSARLLMDRKAAEQA